RGKGYAGGDEFDLRVRRGEERAKLRLHGDQDAPALRGDIRDEAAELQRVAEALLGKQQQRAAVEGRSVPQGTLDPAPRPIVGRILEARLIVAQARVPVSVEKLEEREVHLGRGEVRLDRQ